MLACSEAARWCVLPLVHTVFLNSVTLCVSLSGGVCGVHVLAGRSPRVHEYAVSVVIFAQGCMLSLGLAVLCGTDLHEIVERLVEGEGGGGGRGCASGRFALAVVAGQACSCRNARHGRLVFVGALVAFLAKKRVKKARGSTTQRSE
eukprot:scaffold6551_cov51-Phaeocystis_antarctica.AAC.5